MSRFVPFVFALCISAGFLLQSTSDKVPNYPIFAVSLAFFLATIQLPFIFLKYSTISFPPISVRFTNYLSFATMIASLSTLILAFPIFGQAPHWGIGWAISSGLICFAISVLCKSISKTLLLGYLHYRHVAFLTLCVAFAGLYTDHLLLILPGTIKYNSIFYGMNCLYHFALVPVNFVLGTILVIFDISLPAGLVPPVVSVPFKEDVTVLTLAVVLTTLIIWASLTIYACLVNLAMVGVFEVGGPEGPNLLKQYSWA